MQFCTALTYPKPIALSNAAPPRSTDPIKLMRIDEAAGTFVFMSSAQAEPLPDPLDRNRPRGDCSEDRKERCVHQQWVGLWLTEG